MFDINANLRNLTPYSWQGNKYGPKTLLKALPMEEHLSHEVLILLLPQLLPEPCQFMELVLEPWVAHNYL